MATLSFIGLRNQYELCERGRAFLTLTPDGLRFESPCFLVRLFNRIFRGYSYNALQCSNAIDKKITELLKAPYASFEEIRAACKIIKVSTSILQKSRINDSLGEKTSCLKNLDSRTFSLLEKAYDFHRRENESKIDFFIRERFYDEAYQEMKLHGIPPNCSMESVKTLFRMVYDKNDMAAGIQIITTKEVNLAQLSDYSHYMHYLAHASLDTDKEVAVLLRLAQIPAFRAYYIFSKALEHGLLSVIESYLSDPNLLVLLLDFGKAFNHKNEKLFPLLVQHCAESSDKEVHLGLKRFMEYFGLSRSNPQLLSFLKNRTAIPLDPLISEEVLLDCELSFLKGEPITHNLKAEAFGALIDYLSNKYPKASLSDLLLSSWKCMASDPRKVLSHVKNLSETDFLFQAYQAKKHEVVVTLIEAGTPMTNALFQAHFLITIAYFAIHSSHSVCLGLLLENFPELCEDSYLFLSSVSKGLLECVSLFLAQGKINPNFRDSRGYTALHHAYVNANRELISLLLQHCDPLIKNNAGKTPFQMLMDSQKLSPNDPKVVALLKNISEVSIEGGPLLPAQVYLQCEISFLLGKPCTHNLTADAFNALIDYLSKKYPKADLSDFIFSSWEKISGNPIEMLARIKNIKEAEFIEAAYRNKRYDVVCALIEAGVPFEAPVKNNVIAAHAISCMNSACLVQLLKKCPKLYQSTDLFFECVSYGMTEGVSLFLTQGKIDPDLRQEETGNTALHLAFLSGNMEIISLLFQHCDPLIENKDKKTPLALLIKPTKTSQVVSQLSEPDLPVFINNFFRRCEDEPQGVRLANPDKILKCKALQGTSLDLIELTFLCNWDISKYAIHIKKDEFYKAIPFLTKKYPHAKAQKWFFEAFSLNDKHFTTGAPKQIPKTVPNKASLDDLEAVFDSIPWSKTKEDDLLDIYEFVFEKKHTRHAGDIETLLNKELRDLIHRVRSRKVDTGTPKEGSKPLVDFYKQIELALSHISAKLLAENDPAKTIKFIKEILLAQNYCGGKLFYIAVDQYFKICENRCEDPKEYIEILLAEYRQICFDLIVGQQSDNVHVANKVLFKIGKKLGIPQAVSTFDDHCLPRNIDGIDFSLVETKFLQDEYIPYKIVMGYLLPTIETDAAAGEHYATLQEKLMPKTWNDKRFAPMYRELGRIPKGKNRDQAARALLKEKYDIEPNPKKTPEQDIEDERRDDYFKNFVYETESKRSYVAVATLLEQIGVFKCIFH